jgi:hypothetical protein
MSEKSRQRQFDFFRDATQAALRGYAEVVERAGSEISFDTNSAVDLKPDQNNPTYRGKSTSEVGYLGKTAGTLTVIVFEPRGGSGNETLYSRDQLPRGQNRDRWPRGDYPRTPVTLARSKDRVGREVHLPIAAALDDEAVTTSGLYAGRLDLLDIGPDRRVRKIASLGQPGFAFEGAKPLVTYTVGYAESSSPWLEAGKRYGDPHAVYNPLVAQCCAFLSNAPEQAGDPAMFEAMGALQPDNIYSPTQDMFAFLLPNVIGATPDANR